MEKSFDFVRNVEFMEFFPGCIKMYLHSELLANAWTIVKNNYLFTDFLEILERDVFLYHIKGYNVILRVCMLFL